MTNSSVRLFRSFLAFSALALGLVLAAPAQAIERSSFTMQVLIDGAPIQEYLSRGTSYIEAIEGKEYSIRLTNHTSRRVAVALSVDGLNTIDAKTTSAGDASKWILGPYRTVTLDGWQVSKSKARRFFFTTEEKSYGSWLGKTSNLGVISAAVFREKMPKPMPMYRSGPSLEEPSRQSSGDAMPRKSGREKSGAAESESRDRISALQAPAPDDDYAATGIGRGLDHSVRQVKFRSEPRPAATMQLRYEYRDALVRLGVVPRHYATADEPLSRRERSRGFEDFDFAPDPYRKN